MRPAQPCFLEYDPENVDNPDAPYAVLPVPYEGTVSYGKGTGSAPEAILKASDQLELFDEELFVPVDIATQTLAAPDCVNGSQEEIFNRLYTKARSVLEQGRFLMALGGEHSVSLPLIRAAADITTPLSVLHLDAHTDLRDSYEGNKLSHASVMRRVSEIPVQIVHVGIRSLSHEEYVFLESVQGIVFWARDIVCGENQVWIEQIISALGENVYISLDVDVLDLSLAPSTGTPEPGGMTWYDCIKLLKCVIANRRLVAADIVETVSVPGMRANEYTAAKLAAKIMMYHKHLGCDRE
ncbi:MAG: agmatinase [Lentisphaerae bacterium]|nr:agmatinase [Lentisphaerota bacterium]